MEDVRYYYTYHRRDCKPVVTICIAVIPRSDEYAVGVAVCHPNEPGGPCKAKGRMIARARADTALISKMSKPFAEFQGRRRGMDKNGWIGSNRTGYPISRYYNSVPLSKVSLMIDKIRERHG